MNINKLVKLLLALLAISVTFFSLIAPANAASTDAVHCKNGLSAAALKCAVNGYEWAIAHHQVDNTRFLSIVNFDEPSYKRRLFLIDLQNGRILTSMHVTQGRNSGVVYATHFSNRPGSLESSPGIFTTGRQKYDGTVGESLHVHGLEAGINSNAFRRTIDIHSAWYVTPRFIKQHGYAGRSWGCFAVSPARINRFVDDVKGGSVLFAYTNSENHDSRVDHRLSLKGKKLYSKILSDNSERQFA